MAKTLPPIERTPSPTDRLQYETHQSARQAKSSPSAPAEPHGYSKQSVAREKKIGSSRKSAQVLQGKVDVSVFVSRAGLGRPDYP